MTRPATPDAFFAAIEGPAELARALRAFVRQTAPELSETMSYGFPAYMGAGWALSIVPHSRHVNLQFARGAAMDGEPRLEGTGKNLRHVKVRSPSDLDADLARLIVRAARLDSPQDT